MKPLTLQVLPALTGHDPIKAKKQPAKTKRFDLPTNP
jgi:hypothetical protein